MVIGSGGSGKSTLSRKLGEITGIPVIHLDSLYWQPGWVEPDKEEWRDTMAREIERPSWIMDGNFGGTREMRMRAADTVIFLDLPRWLCMLRVLKRRLTHTGETRPDMAEGCPEKVDLKFLAWVWTYKRRSGRRVLEELSAMPHKRLIRLRTRHEVAAFLEDPYAYKAG